MVAIKQHKACFVFQTLYPNYGDGCQLSEPCIRLDLCRASSLNLNLTSLIPLRHVQASSVVCSGGSEPLTPSAAAAAEGLRVRIEWFAQQPLAWVCLELRSSLEYVTKFLSLSHNWSSLPVSLAMRPYIRASPPAHPTKSFMFPNRSLSEAPRFQQQQTSICLPNS